MKTTEAMMKKTTIRKSWMIHQAPVKIAIRTIRRQKRKRNKKKVTMMMMTERNMIIKMAKLNLWK